MLIFKKLSTFISIFVISCLFSTYSAKISEKAPLKKPDYKTYLILISILIAIVIIGVVAYIYTVAKPKRNTSINAKQQLADAQSKLKQAQQEQAAEFASQEQATPQVQVDNKTLLYTQARLRQQQAEVFKQQQAEIFKQQQAEVFKQQQAARQQADAAQARQRDRTEQARLMQLLEDGRLQNGKLSEDTRTIQAATLDIIHSQLQQDYTIAMQRRERPAEPLTPDKPADNVAGVTELEQSMRAQQDETALMSPGVSALAEDLDKWPVPRTTSEVERQNADMDELANLQSDLEILSEVFQTYFDTGRHILPVFEEFSAEVTTLFVSSYLSDTETQIAKQYSIAFKAADAVKIQNLQGLQKRDTRRTMAALAARVDAVIALIQNCKLQLQLIDLATAEAQVGLYGVSACESLKNKLEARKKQYQAFREYIADEPAYFSRYSDLLQLKKICEKYVPKS